MLSKRFSGILPDLSYEQSLETSKIYSIAGHPLGSGLLKRRPVRSPHHTVSYAAMAGGGSKALPGEISLAHNGVLFLDEFPEYRRDVLETLRQPLENGEITVSRMRRSVNYPCRFILIAAMNPCPCGYFTDPSKTCKCTPNQIQKYLSRVSGPLLDRIDIHLEVPRLKYEKLSQKRKGEPSKKIKERVLACRKEQNRRFAANGSSNRVNAGMSHGDIETYCRLSGDAEELLKSAILELGISARAYDKLLKISRTIADMEGSGLIEAHHISEAVGYRCLDRNLWT
jgi:magnesium chelatase family protein